MSEVLSRFREKFPSYDSRPDRELVLAVGRKYPAYLARDPDFQDEFNRFERGEELREQKLELQGEPEPSMLGELGKISKDMGKLFARSVVESGLAAPLEALARAKSPGEQLADRADRGILNISTLPSSEDTVPFKLATALRQGVKDLLGDIDPDTESGFGTGTLPQALGSATGFLAGGATLGLARVPALVAVAGLGASSGGVEGYRRAKIAGADEETAMRSFALNAGVGSSEAIPLGNMLKRLNKASGNALSRALFEGTEESLQELFQSVSGNVIANTLTDEDVGVLEGTLESSAAGGLTGFLLSALVSTKGNFSAGRAARAREQQVEFAAANRRPAQPTSEAQLDKLFGLDAPSETQKKPRPPRKPKPKPKPKPDTEQQRAFDVAPKTIFNEMFEKARNDSLGGAFTPVSLDPDPKMQALARQLQSKRRRVALDEGGKLPSRGFGFDQITVEIDPSLENVPPPTADELTFMVNRETMLAAQEMDASRKRRAELTGGGQLGSAVGATFSNLPVTPDFLKSAEQKVEKSEREQIVETEVDAVDMNTPLKTVEDIVRSQLERRDFAAAVATLGNTPAAVSAQVIDETLGTGRDPVTLDAAERTIFNEIWSKVYTESLSQTPAAASVEDAVTLSKPSILIAGLPPTQSALERSGVVPASNEVRARAIKAFIDTYIPHPNDEKVAVDLDTSSSAPDFLPYDQALKIANRPNGLGRILGLSWIFDPRARANTPAQKALITRAFEGTVGNAIGSVMAQQLKGKIDNAFDMEGSKITNVMLVNPKAPLHLSDFFEHYQESPRDYALTPRQKEAVELSLSELKEIQDLMSRNGITREGVETQENISEDRPYFPRSRLLTPEEKAEVSKAGSKSGTGASLSALKSRFFQSEEQGTGAGITYEPSIEKRLSTLLTRSYQAIADKRLLDNPALKGETLKDREARFLAEFEAEIAAGEFTEEQVLAKAQEATPGKDAKVDARRLGQFFFKVEEAGVLNKAFKNSSNSFIENTKSLNTAMKSLMLGADFAAPVLQGQMVAFRNPGIWAKATGHHFKAWFTPQVMQRYLEDPTNLRAMRELSQLGVGFGQMQDFISGVSEGGIIPETFRKAGKIGTAAGSAFERFARSFQTFNEVALIEMWKGQRDTAKKEDWPILAESLQNVLSQGRREEIGISKEGKLFGDLFLLAPSYLRGSVNLIASLASGGQSGKQARRSLGSWLIGGHLAYIGAALAASAAGLAPELDFEDILKRLDPGESDHMMIPIKLPDGRTRNIGLGGPMRSLLRLMGEIQESIVKGDGKLLEAGFGNPVNRWLRGKLAPMPGMATEMVLGEDFLGNEVTPLEILASRSLPLSAQTLKDIVFPIEGQTPPVLGEIALGFFGLQSWPENTRKQMAREMDKSARDKGYSDFDALPLLERVKVFNEDILKRPIFEKTELSEKNIEAGIKAGRERAEALKEGLPTEARDKMNEWKLKVPGYKNTLNFSRGKLLPLNQDQRKRYGELIQARYNAVMTKLPWELLEKREKSVRQDVINSVLNKQKKVARGELLREMNATVEQPKP